MSLIVHKYGGTSVANTEKLDSIAKELIQLSSQGHDLIVVVSAMGKTTDQLVELAKQCSNTPQGKHYDLLLSSGEQVTASLLALRIEALGNPSVALLGRDIKIKTTNEFNQAKIISIDTQTIQKHIKENRIIIVAGFQGVNQNDEITTLGRGGSDLTAVALAVALKADHCKILTDVDGIYVTDPRIIPQAKRIDTISYEEMLELASLGAKVIHSRAVELAQKHHLNLFVGSSFGNRIGTWITKENKHMENALITGITYHQNESKITIHKVIDKPGISAVLFNHLAQNHINIDIIVQNTSINHLTDISFTVPHQDCEKVLKLCQDIKSEVHFEDVSHQNNLSKISIIGVGMKRNYGVASKMFSLLAEEKINIEMITTSEIRISCLIQSDRVQDAVKVLYKGFNINSEPTPS